MPKRRPFFSVSKRSVQWYVIPSGKRLHNYGKIHPFLLGKLTLSMAIYTIACGIIVGWGITIHGWRIIRFGYGIILGWGIIRFGYRIICFGYGIICWPYNSYVKLPEDTYFIVLSTFLSILGFQNWRFPKMVPIGTPHRPFFWLYLVLKPMVTWGSPIGFRTPPSGCFHRWGLSNHDRPFDVWG